MRAHSLTSSVQPILDGLHELQNALEQHKTKLQEYRAELDQRQISLQDKKSKLTSDIQVVNLELDGLLAEVKKLEYKKQDAYYLKQNAQKQVGVKKEWFSEMTCSEYSASTFCKVTCNHEGWRDVAVFEPDLEVRTEAARNLKLLEEKIKKQQIVIQNANNRYNEIKEQSAAKIKLIQEEQSGAAEDQKLVGQQIRILLGSQKGLNLILSSQQNEEALSMHIFNPYGTLQSVLYGVSQLRGEEDIIKTLKKEGVEDALFLDSVAGVIASYRFPFFSTQLKHNIPKLVEDIRPKQTFVR